MDLIGANIKHLRRVHSLTQDDLAKKLNVKRSQIGSYEEGRATPKLPLLQFLAEYFQLTLDDLVNRDLSETTNTTEDFDKTGKTLRILTTVVDKEDNERFVMVPEKASAGYTSGYSDPTYIERLPVFDLPIPELRSDRTYRVFQIKGNSMNPILPGSYIICEYLVNINDLQYGDPHIVVTKNDGIVYKRILRNNNDSSKVIFKSDNPDYQNYSMAWDDILEVWKAVGFISTQLPEAKDVTLNRLQGLISKLTNELDMFNS